MVVTDDSKSEEKEYVIGSLRYLLWFVGYIVLIYLAGVLVSTAIFLGTFLLFEAKMRWWGVLISIVSTIVLLNIISSVMNLCWPQSLLGF